MQLVAASVQVLLSGSASCFYLDSRLLTPGVCLASLSDSEPVILLYMYQISPMSLLFDAASIVVTRNHVVISM